MYRFFYFIDLFLNVWVNFSIPTLKFALEDHWNSLFFTESHQNLVLANSVIQLQWIYKYFNKILITFQ